MTQDILHQFFARVIDGLKADAADKQQKIPASSLRAETDDTGGQLYAADYFKYLIHGRGPGKQPPPDKMLAWVSQNPETYSWTDAEKSSLAYVIGRKIAREGTEIWAGRRHGIDLLGVMEKQIPSLLSALAKNEVINVQTALRSAIKK